MIIISDSIEEELAAFCQKIRALTFNSRPIIMALSKSADTSDRIKVLDIGADDFLSEPVSIEEFKTRVKAHLRRDIETGLDCKTLLPNLKLTKKILKRTITKESFAILLIEINNLKEEGIRVTGDLTIDQAVVMSENKDAITNSGTQQTQPAQVQPIVVDEPEDSLDREAIMKDFTERRIRRTLNKAQLAPAYPRVFRLRRKGIRGQLYRPRIRQCGYIHFTRLEKL